MLNKLVGGIVVAALGALAAPVVAQALPVGVRTHAKLYAGPHKAVEPSSSAKWDGRVASTVDRVDCVITGDVGGNGWHACLFRVDVVGGSALQNVDYHFVGNYDGSGWAEARDWKINPGQWITGGRFGVVPRADTVREGPETVKLKLTAWSRRWDPCPDVFRNPSSYGWFGLGAISSSLVCGIWPDKVGIETKIIPAIEYVTVTIEDPPAPAVAPPPPKPPVETTPSIYPDAAPSVGEGEVGTTPLHFRGTARCPALMVNGCFLQIQVKGGTATAGRDFEIRTFTQVLRSQTPGTALNQRYDFEIPVRGDFLVEPDETVTVQVMLLPRGLDGLPTGGGAVMTQTGKVVDDDQVSHPVPGGSVVVP